MSAGRRVAGHPARVSPKGERGQEPLGKVLHGLEVVYYVRHKGAVKIGYTANLPARLRSLGCKLSDVVAFELGGRDLEQQRHRQFAALRIRAAGYGVEHYRIAEPLIGHVNETMRATREALTRRVA